MKKTLMLATAVLAVLTLSRAATAQVSGLRAITSVRGISSIVSPNDYIGLQTGAPSIELLRVIATGNLELDDRDFRGARIYTQNLVANPEGTYNFVATVVKPDNQCTPTPTHGCTGTVVSTSSVDSGIPVVNSCTP